MSKISRLRNDVADCREDIQSLRNELQWMQKDVREYEALVNKLLNRWNEAYYEMQQIAAYLGLRWEADAGQLVADEPQSLGLRQEIAELRTRWSTTYYQLERQGLVQTPCALAGADVELVPNLRRVAEILLLVLDHLGLDYDESSGQLLATEAGGETWDDDQES